MHFPLEVTCAFPTLAKLVGGWCWSLFVLFDWDIRDSACWYIYIFKKKMFLWLWTSFKFTKEWLKKAVLLLFRFELSHQCVSSSCYDLLTYCNVKLASFTASSSCDILTFMNVMKIALPPWPKFSVIMALNKKREKKDIVHHFNAAVSV